MASTPNLNARQATYHPAFWEGLKWGVLEESGGARISWLPRENSEEERAFFNKGEASIMNYRRDTCSDGFSG